MSKKTKIIFIITFILVGIIIVGIYAYVKNTSSPTANPKASIYQKFNPFGSSSKVPTANNTDGSTTITQTTGDVANLTSRLSQITDFAISGATFLEDTKNAPEGLTPDPNSVNLNLIPSLRYVERATGHIYQMYLDTKTSGKISNSTIPGVYEVLFNGKANTTIYRYATDDNTGITSFIATLGGSSNFLTPDILSISLSPDKNSFFSLIKNKSGVVGIIKSFDDSKTNQIFTSNFSEWTPQWVTKGNIYLTTKPSYLVDGSIFSLNISNGTLTKLFGGIPGLTTLADGTGDFVLFGASLASGPTLNIFDIKNHTSTKLDVYGLPEKCIWSNDNINVYCALPNTIQGINYPDYWYQGLVSFTDYFVKINTKTKEISTLANSQDETPIDATNLFLSKKEDKLFFTNKKDYTLWSLDL